MNKLLYLLFTLLPFTTLKSQGSLLLLSNTDCSVTIDGEKRENLVKDTPLKISCAEGEHIIQASSNNGKNFTKVIEVTNQKQKVLQIDFKDQLVEKGIANTLVKGEEGFQLVTETHLNLMGVGSGISSDGKGTIKIDANNNDLHFAFEQGDEILINGAIQNKKGKFFISLIKYPEENIIYSNQKLDKLSNQKITIRQRGIYTVRTGTHALLPKKIKLTIERKPINELSKEFNTNVIEKVRYNTVPLLQPTSHYLNSQMKDAFASGKSGISVSVHVPEDIESWFYMISASRNEKDIKSNIENFSLVGDLAKVINGATLTTAALKIGLDFLSKPPGVDYCNIYLLDNIGISNYKASGKIMGYVKEGTRENVKSATVDIVNSKSSEYYLYISNPETWHGLHIGIEAVGITKEMYLDYADSKLQQVAQKK